MVSLWITTSADRIGRRRMLVLGAGLIALAGGVLSSTSSLALIAAAAVIGVVSPNGSEIGPFISIEQSALAQIVGDGRRTRVFAWYNLAGSFAAALGALAGGALVQGLRGAGYGELASYRAVLAVYAGIGVVLGLLFTRLSPASRRRRAPPPRRCAAASGCTAPERRSSGSAGSSPSTPSAAGS